MPWDQVLEQAFSPKTIAIVGVSSESRRGDPWAPGGTAFINSHEQLGFKGRLYPVNPKAKEVLGYKAYPTVKDIPEPVDLVIVAVPAPALPAVLEDCLQARVGVIHVFTSGFEETGEPEGIELGRRVKEIAQKGGLRLIGPNCMGLYVPSSRIGTFPNLPTRSGPVAFLSQSGGHCNWFCHYGRNYGLYFSKVISYGNAYVLDSTDFLEFLGEDPETEILCLYLEGVKDGRKLLHQVRRINPFKPVILWKAGLTDHGSRAVASHTASLAGQEPIWKGFFAQTGAVPVFSLEEMAETAMTFRYLKPPKGNRAAVLGLGGGTSVSAADTLSREGLAVPPLSEKTQKELKKIIPLAGASIRNPLDTGLVFRNVATLAEELGWVAADPSIDLLIVMPHLDMARHAGMEEVERLIAFLMDFARENPFQKPVALVFHSFLNDDWEGALRLKLRQELPNQGIPVYSTLAGAARALAKAASYHQFQRNKEGRGLEA